MGRFIVKNVNFFIVFMLLITMLFLVGSSVFYENKFDDLSDNYVNTLKRMQAAEKYQTLYLDAIKSLNTTSKSIQYYDQLYENKTAELKKTKKDMGDKIDTLDSQLSTAQSDLKSKIKDLSDSKAKVLALTTSYNTLYKDYQEELTDKKYWKRRYEKLKTNCTSS